MLYERYFHWLIRSYSGIKRDATHRRVRSSSRQVIHSEPLAWGWDLKIDREINRATSAPFFSRDYDHVYFACRDVRKRGHYSCTRIRISIRWMELTRVVPQLLLLWILADRETDWYMISRYPSSAIIRSAGYIYRWRVFFFNKINQERSLFIIEIFQKFSFIFFITR